jgi:hypothetical protein
MLFIKIPDLHLFPYYLVLYILEWLTFQILLIFLWFKHWFLFILHLIIIKYIFLKYIFHLHLIYKVSLFFLERKIQLFEIIIFLQVSKSGWYILYYWVGILVTVSIFTFKFSCNQRLLWGIRVFLLKNIQLLVIIICSVIS